MFKMKKILSLLMVMGIIASVGINAFALTPVNADYIVNEIKSVYREYDVECEVVEIDSSVNYTKDEVDQQLLLLKNSLENSNEFVHLGVISNSTNLSRWSYDKTYTTYANVSNGLNGDTTLELKCTARIYDGTVTFENISNITTREYGYGDNVVSWTQTSSGSTISNDKKTADVWAIGTLVTECDVAGRRVRVTRDFTVGMIIQAK